MCSPYHKSNKLQKWMRRDAAGYAAPADRARARMTEWDSEIRVRGVLPMVKGLQLVSVGGQGTNHTSTGKALCAFHVFYQALTSNIFGCLYVLSTGSMFCMRCSSGLSWL